MQIFNILLGVFFIEKNPGLIAGYNTMPKDQKKNVNVVGLSTSIPEIKSKTNEYSHDIVCKGSFLLEY